MTIQNEVDRLNEMIGDVELSNEQRQAASDALDETDNNEILNDWAAIEANGAQLQELTNQLNQVITDINSNVNVATSIDKITEILTEATGDP